MEDPQGELPWSFLGPHFVVEPQAQIIWAQTSFQAANDGLGPVDLGTTGGPTGRLGLRGKWTIIDPGGWIWQPYVQANVWRDWDTGSNTMFGIDQVPLIQQATRLEFAGGVTARFGANWNIYAQGGDQFATNENNNNPYRRDGVNGSVGVKYRW